MKTFTLLLLIIFNSYANEFLIKKEFKSFFYSPIVKDGQCQNNIREFVKHLTSLGLFNSKIRFVDITAPRNPWTLGTSVPAFNSRFGTKKNGMYHQNWKYHFFMLLNGKVYDFSYDEKPRILSLKKYMDEMYLPTRDIMLYGKGFRVRGMGPYLTREIAKAERENFVFNAYKTNPKAEKFIENKNLNFKQLIRLYK